MRQRTSKESVKLIYSWACSLPLRALKNSLFPHEIPLEKTLYFHLKVVINWRLLLG